MTTTARISIIPFAFAKRHGVLLTEIVDGIAQVFYYHSPHVAILSELRRRLGIPLRLTAVDQETFGRLLVKTYETDSSLAMQMAEDMGEEMDLFHLMQE